MDESNNIFNSISIGDLNDAQKELKKKMKESAVEKGVLDIAKNIFENTVIGYDRLTKTLFFEEKNKPI